MAQQVSVALVQAVLPEGNPGDTQTQFDFVITRSGATDEPLDVNWELRLAGTDPAEVNDFAPEQPTSGTVSFDAGVEEQTVSVFIARDLTVELDEPFALALDGNGLPEGTTLGTASAVATISNDDPTTVIISPSLAQALDEGNPDGSPATFSYTLTREGDLSQELTVDWQVAPQGNFPIDADDFGGKLPNGTVTFAADESEAATPITFAASTDSTVEPDEQFQVELSLADDAPAGTILQLEEVSGRIVNDDVVAPAVVSIAATDAVKLEGNTGDAPPTDFIFTVSRTGDTSQDAVVTWQGTATGSNPADTGDFDVTLGLGLSGEVTIPADQTSVELIVKVLGDTVVEENETFQITLTGTSDGTLGQATATGTIQDDDAAAPVVSIADSSQAEGDAEQTDFTFTVSRTGDTSEAVTVHWKVGPGTDPSANNADFVDFAPLEGDITIPDGETSVDLVIPVEGDTEVEPDETFTVTLSEPSIGTLGQATATGTIQNDDVSLLPVVTIDSVDSLFEGDDETTEFTVTLSREGNLSQVTNFKLSIEASGAADSVNADDFGIRGEFDTLPFKVLGAFGLGEETTQVSFQVRGDLDFEPDESFIVRVEDLENGTIAEPTAAGQILTDEQQVNVTLDPAALPEGDGGTGETPTQFDFLVTRAGKIDAPLDVKWDLVAIDPNPAGIDDLMIGEDDKTGIVSFAPGEEARTVSVRVQGDTVLENNEQFGLSLRDDGFTANTTLGQAQAVATIENDESSVLISPSLLVEKEEGDRPATAGTFSYQLVRTGDTSQALTVSWAVKPREGAQNQVDADDFGGTLPDGDVIFAPGQSGQETDTPVTFSFQANPDNTGEFDEDFQVELSLPADAPAGTTLQVPEVFGAILNDDQGRLSIAPALISQKEGDPEQTTPYTFTVTRSDDDAGTATVDYTVAPDSVSGPPTDPDDFASDQDFEGTLTFDDGDTEKFITVNIAGDYEYEGDEHFKVTLSNASGNVFIDGSQDKATGEVVEDDQSVGVSPPYPSEQPEGNPGDTPTRLEFNVSRQGATDAALDVQWELDLTGGLTADDLIAGQQLSGTVSFAPGDTMETVTVDILGDNVVEEDEQFTLRLNPDDLPPNTSINEFRPSAVATVLDDDTPQLSISPGDPESLEEGDEGPKAFTFTVTREGNEEGLSEPSSAAWEVDLANSTATAEDLTGPLSGTVDFAPEETSQPITVNVSGDLVIENNENLSVRLFNPDANATIVGEQATMVIETDDFVPWVAFRSPHISGQEGDEGATQFIFPVDRTGKILSERTTVEWQVIGGTSPGDVNPADFASGALPSGTLTFEPGDDSKDLIVEVGGDRKIEQTETFTVKLKNPQNATLGLQEAVGQIIDDDALPTLVIVPSDLSQSEGDTASTPFSFTVNRSGANVNETATVDWEVSGSGDAKADAGDFVDGTQFSDTLEFAPGERVQTITLDVVGDTVPESDEAFTVTLSRPDNALLSDESATGLIVNDDSAAELSIGPADFVQDEGDGGATAYTFTVTRSGSDEDLNQETTVDWTVTPTDATGASRDDFVSGRFPSGTLTFAPGDDLPKDIVIEVQGDTEPEPDEGFQVTLSNPENGIIVQATATGTIVDDEGASVINGTEEDDSNLTGTEQDDIINGLGGKDTITGKGGNDTIDGGEGEDTLIGGEGEDDFVFAGSTNDDEILDFTQGEDQIDLTAYPGTTWSKLRGNIEYDNRDSETRIEDFGSDRDKITLVGSVQILNETDFIFAGGNSIYISDVQVAEGDTGTATDAVFTVSLSSPVDAPVTVDYATADGTATAGSDYTAVSGTLTFAPDQTEQEVRVPITGDGALEPNESFFVNLSNPVNDVIADGQGEATILDDDAVSADQTATNADEVFDGTDGDDILQGGNGDDALSGLAGDDALSGRSGDDTIDGGAGDDILAGGSGDDTLAGGGDDDVLGGGSGNDVLEGGAGDDALSGGSGDDQLSGGSGNDALIGGSGYDSFVFRAADGDSGQDTIRLFNADEDTLAFEEYGERLDAFSDLDTSGNGVLDDGDAHVSVDAGNTVIDLGGQTDGESGGTLTLVGVIGLEVDDMAFN